METHRRLGTSLNTAWITDGYAEADILIAQWSKKNVFLLGSNGRNY